MPSRKPMGTVLLGAALFVQGALLPPVASAESGARVDPRWEALAPQPIARLEGPPAVVSGRLYVFGGFHRPRGELRVTTRVDAYDPGRDVWSRLSDMPLALTHALTAVDGDTVWLVGGYDPEKRVVASTLRYHAPTDAWSPGTPLPEPRAGGALVRHERTLHYFGGFSHDRNTTYGDHWALSLEEPTAWRRLAPLPRPRGHLAGAVLAGRIYAVGGQLQHDEGRDDVAWVHAYDPQADGWREVASLPTGRSHIELSTIVHAGRLYVFGGRNDGPGRSRIRRNQALPDVTEYDPETDTWTPQPELPMGLVAPVAVEIGSRIIVTSGSSHRAHEPRSETWGGRFAPDAEPR